MEFETKSDGNSHEPKPVKHAKCAPDRCIQENQRAINGILTGISVWGYNIDKGLKKVWTTRVRGVATR